jgi:O-antigen ligase
VGIDRSYIYKVNFFAFLLLLFTAGVVGFPAGGMLIAGYHLLAVAFFFVLKDFKLYRKAYLLVICASIYFLWGGAGSLLSGLGVGGLISLVFCTYTFILSYTVVRRFEIDSIAYLQSVALIYSFLVVLKDFVFWDKLKLYIASGGHSTHIDMPFLVPGGTNTESSWMVILCGVFLRHRLFYLLWGVSFAVSLLYSSRASSALALLLLVIKIYSDKVSITKIVFIVVVGTYAFSSISSLNLNIFERIEKLDSDKGLSGRQYIWPFVGGVLRENPVFGVGPTNAIDAVSKRSGITYKESNVHNLYMQVMLDYGVVGGVLFIFFALYVLLRIGLSRFENPFSPAVFLYLLGGLVQFQGYEVAIWALFAMYYAQEKIDLY